MTLSSVFLPHRVNDGLLLHSLLEFISLRIPWDWSILSWNPPDSLVPPIHRGYACMPQYYKWEKRVPFLCCCGTCSHRFQSQLSAYVVPDSSPRDFPEPTPEQSRPEKCSGKRRSPLVCAAE